MAGLLVYTYCITYYKPEKLAAFYEKRQLEKTGLLKWEGLKNHLLPQDFADMLGWEEISKKMAAAYNSLSNDEKNTLFYFVIITDKLAR